MLVKARTNYSCHATDYFETVSARLQVHAYIYSQPYHSAPHCFRHCVFSVQRLYSNMVQWERFIFVFIILAIDQVVNQVVQMNLEADKPPPQMVHVSAVSPACQSVCNCTGGYVDCSNQSLTSVPVDLPVNMTSLNLSRNAIHDLPNGIFSDFRSLASLDVSYNNITRLNVGSFTGLSGLASLDLSWNKIPLNNESYPADVFRPLAASLSHLRLGGNAGRTPALDTGYPDEALSVLQGLKYLVLDGLPHVDLGSGLAQLHNLRNLSLKGLPDGYCSMPELTNSTFSSLPQTVRSLNLTNCNIREVDREAFRPLRNLTTFDLSRNTQLGFGTLGEAFYSLQGSQLQHLHINEIMDRYAVCVAIDVNHTRYFKDTWLRTIHAESNRIELFRRGSLDNLPDTLTFVSVSGNRLSFGDYFQDFVHLPSLKIVQNDGFLRPPEPPNYYPTFSLQSELCQTSPYAEKSDAGCHRPLRSEKGESAGWPTGLRYGSREGADPSFLGLTYVLPPNLTSFVSRWNQLHYMLVNIKFDPNNTLTKLDLSNNLLAEWIGPFTGLQVLETLDLSNNFAHVINYSFFDTFPALKVLRLSRNYVRVPLMLDVDGRMFARLEKLEYLDLSSNYINTIPAEAFQGLKNLRGLNLSHNAIFDFEITVSQMKNLTFLDLSYNNIKFLPRYIMDHLDAVAANPNVTVYVNLTFNPIACLCQHIDFLNWIQQSDVKFLHENEYSCLRSDGSVKKMTNIFDEIQILQKTCGNFTGMLTGAVTCIFFILLALVSALLYRFRWKLRYFYYASRLAYGKKRMSMDDCCFEYDAFVSYCSEDEAFVQGDLMQQLEERKGLRLYVHSRDFTPGRPIACNIVAAVQNSRRTLVVLTQRLLQSDWCQYEMQMATMEAVHTGRDVLLFLLYEDIPSQDIPRQVLYNLQSSTYIQFPHDDPSLLPSFWIRLANALKEQ